MKSKRLLAATMFGLLGLVGCGDSVQSPDFTALLTELDLDSDALVDTMPGVGAPLDQRFLAAGDSASLDLTGTFTTPPGSPSDSVDAPITGADYTISPAGAATVSKDTLVGVTLGSTVRVSTTRGGIPSNVLTFRIGPAILSSIDISPATSTISTLGATTFTATGTFSDGAMRPIEVTWSVVNSPADGGVILSNLSGQSTRATPVDGSEGTSAVITATATLSDGNGGMVTRTDTASISISSETLDRVTAVQPSNASVAPTGTVDFTAIGSFSDLSATPPVSRTGEIDDSAIDWTSSAPASADFVTPADRANGVATGIGPGSTTTITATLKASIPSPSTPSLRTASTSLFVTDARCTAPLVSPPATTLVTTSDTCLICGVATPEAVIDGSINTFAVMSQTVALLNGTVTLAVNGNAGPQPATRTGFVVAKPAGTLLSAELLSTLTVSTLDASGMVLESSSTGAELLRLTLLGTIGGQDAALLSFVPTMPFNGLALTFDSGLLSALPTVNVLQACAAAVDTSPAP